jgi:hypothetical protein
MVMTISIRNAVVTAGLILCLVMLALFVWGSFLIAPAFPSFSKPGLEHSGLPAFLSNPSPNLLDMILAIGFPVFFSSISTLAIRYLFRKATSPETFFFAVFVVSLSMEAFRMTPLMMTGVENAAFYGFAVTRIVYFSRFFGIFGLFVSSLFAVGITYQNYGKILFLDFLISFTIVTLVPINGEALVQGFLFEPGYGPMLASTYYAMAIFSLVDFLLASATTNVREYAYAGIGMAMAVAGREILSFVPRLPWLIGGILLLTLGTNLFVRKTHRMYLWL